MESSHTFLFLFLSTLSTTLLLLLPATIHAGVACFPSSPELGDDFCRDTIGPGSSCDSDSFLCTNPYQQGCFYQLWTQRQQLYNNAVAAIFNETQEFETTITIPNTTTVENSSTIMQPPKKRVCNSNDVSSDDDAKFSPEATTCQSPAPFEYTEIILHGGTWDSSLALAWIYQIVLSEHLQVPVTLGTTSTRTSSDEDPPTSSQLSFYATTSGFQFSQLPTAWEALEVANSKPNGDCQQETLDDKYNNTLASTTLNGDNDYCAHAMPEVWPLDPKWDQAVQEGVIDPTVTTNGLVGSMGFYIPKFTAQQHPSLSSVYGLAGDENRPTLVETFRQPYTWTYYCQAVSETKCTQPDVVAERVPFTPQEAFSFFVPGLFTGYFGNGITTPSTAAEHDEEGIGSTTTTNVSTSRKGSLKMGHVIVPSCSDDLPPMPISSTAIWFQSMLEANNISLTSQGNLPPNHGYSRDHMMQIWSAANATKSHVMMLWWKPDAFMESFRGSDFEFQKVAVPMISQDYAELCLQTINNETIASVEQHCGSKYTERLSQLCQIDPSSPQPLRIAMASTLRETWEAAKPVDKSPAYETLRNLQVTDQDIQSILKEWRQPRKSVLAAGQSYSPNENWLEQNELWGYQAREAVCTWVVDHWNELNAAIPSGYPRVWNNSTASMDFDQSYLTAAEVVAAFVSVVVLLTGTAMAHWRKRLVIVYAQTQFILQVLLGFWFLTMAAILFTREPTDSRCLLGHQWLVLMGATLGWVPLVVKMGAMNQAALASPKGNYHHIHISPLKMFSVELSVAACVVMFLMIWTANDPLSRVETKSLVTSNDDKFDTIQVSVECASKSETWMLVAWGWQAAILLTGTILSVVSWKVVQEFREVAALARAIYCQAIFFVPRIILFIRRDAIEIQIYSAATSFLLSFGALFSVLFYFAPILLRIAQGSSSDLMEMEDIHYPEDVISARMQGQGEGFAATGQRQEHMATGNGSGGDQLQPQHSRADAFHHPSSVGMGSVSGNYSYYDHDANLTLLHRFFFQRRGDDMGVSNPSQLDMSLSRRQQDFFPRVDEQPQEGNDDPGDEEPITAECSRT